MRNGRLLRKGTSMKRLYFIGTNDASAQDGIQALSWDGDSLRLEKTAGGGPACTSYLTLTPDGYLLAVWRGIPFSAFLAAGWYAVNTKMGRSAR